MPDTSAPLVAIVDYGMGNLYSVARACAHIGLRTAVTSSPAEVRAADGVILPGVGAMPHAMRALDGAGLSDALREVAARGTPLMGVCLGLQLLMRRGSEFTEHAGLGIVDGEVVRFEGTEPDGRPLRVPHIGWSPIRRPEAAPERAWADTPLAAIGDGAYMYFVHSYYVIPADPAVVVSTTEYQGIEFCSAIRQGSVFACQFHPERSGALGLSVYGGFAASLACGAPLPSPG